MPCHGWGIITVMHALQGQAAERARANALEARLRQQGGDLAAMRAKLDEALQQRQGGKPKVRTPLLCMAAGI